MLNHRLRHLAAATFAVGILVAVNGTRHAKAAPVEPAPATVHTVQYAHPYYARPYYHRPYYYRRYYYRPRFYGYHYGYYGRRGYYR